MKLKKQNAITLIALVITIIVLLILAGISLSLVLGENGITNRAIKAGKIQNISGAKEKLELDIANYASEYYQAKYVNGDNVSTIQAYVLSKYTDGAEIEYADNFKLKRQGNDLILTSNTESDKTTTETATIGTDGKVSWNGITIVESSSSGVVENPYPADTEWTAGWQKVGGEWNVGDIAYSPETVLTGDIIARVYPINEEKTIFHLVIEKPATTSGNATEIRDIKQVASAHKLRVNDLEGGLLGAMMDPGYGGGGGIVGPGGGGIVGPGGGGTFPSITYPYWRNNYRSTISKITICSGVTEIENNWFGGCTNLTNVTIPNSVTSIGDSAFSGCSNLTNVTIPNSVTIIGEQAFINCWGLTSISLPDSLTTISQGAFSFTPLKSLAIPSSVTSIPVGIITPSSSLEYITVDNGNTHYDSRNNCNAIIETSTNKLLLGSKNTVIPDDVTAICGCAFQGLSSITSITLPDEVTSIGFYAFFGCSDLTNVTIPTSVTSIGESAFGNCTNLTSINYNGTMDQWNAITGHGEVSDKNIVCTDGTISAN